MTDDGLAGHRMRYINTFRKWTVNNTLGCVLLSGSHQRHEKGQPNAGSKAIVHVIFRTSTEVAINMLRINISILYNSNYKELYNELYVPCKLETW